ncbi:MAG: hypothetical protein K9K38_05390 [Rhodoferax sp.]|nr:hypothetical protein [Rhodoferax sp.]MCF8208826.1 hypothetical protein [Rhodoferax sp.]
MKKIISLLALFCLLAGLVGATRAATPEVSVAPSLNQGKKWRVAYIESGPYTNYAGTFYYLLKGLEARGWVKGVERVPFTWGQVDTREMWNYISAQREFSTYIEFIPDGYYSLKSIPGKESEVLKRFSEKKDADLMIVMGTVAGKLMASDDNQSKAMVFSTSNAVKSGIVKTLNSSGRPKVWAHLDPVRYKQQLQVFSDIFHFKKMGVVYEDSPNGKAFAAVDDIEAVAKEKRFEIVRKLVPGAKNAEDQDRYFKDLLQAHTELASEVDGFYYAISPAPGLRPEHIYPVLKPFYDKQIPVFSQLGDEEVSRGALLSLARADFTGMGQFGAVQMAKLLNGASADALPQVYSDTPTIALNFHVAKQIGYKPPFEILLVSDKVFLMVESVPVAPSVPSTTPVAKKK